MNEEQIWVKNSLLMEMYFYLGSVPWCGLCAFCRLLYLAGGIIVLPWFLQGKKKRQISNENITFPKYFNNIWWWLVLQMSTWIRLGKSCFKTQIRLSFCLLCNSWRFFGIKCTKTFQLVTISMCIHMFKTSYRNWAVLWFFLYLKSKVQSYLMWKKSGLFTASLWCYI